MARAHSAAGRESKACLHPTRLVFLDETATSTNMVRLRAAVGVGSD